MTKTILAVDDSRTIRSAIEYTFGSTGIQVVGVDTGADALANLGRLNAALVLVDVGLPEQDGYEVAKAIRGQAPGVPVLLLTSSVYPYDEPRAIEAGASGHIGKPFETQALIDLVEQTIAEGAPASPAPAVAEDWSAGIHTEDAAWAGSDDVEEIEDIDIEDLPDDDALLDEPPSQASISLDLGGAGEPAPSQEVGLTAPGEELEVAPVVELDEVVQPAAPPPSFDLPSDVPSPNTFDVVPEPPPHSQDVLTALPADELRAIAREVFERVAWEVVPELAETIIREEIARLTRDE